MKYDSFHKCLCDYVFTYLNFLPASFSHIFYYGKGVELLYYFILFYLNDIFFIYEYLNSVGCNDKLVYKMHTFPFAPPEGREFLTWHHIFIYVYVVMSYLCRKRGIRQLYFLNLPMVDSCLRYGQLYLLDSSRTDPFCPYGKL